MISTILSAAAFGDDPGHWPLPAARNVEERLLRAVAAGGQGRYSSAEAELADLLRREPRGRFASLAMSTRASFHRQLGWHARARGWDGRALAAAGHDPEAGVDAMIGLAADALGLGRLAASAALLTRATAALDCAEAPPTRLAIRLAWVSAELAMAAGGVLLPGAMLSAASSYPTWPCPRCAGTGSKAMSSSRRRCVVPASWRIPGPWPTPPWPKPTIWAWCRCGGRWPACSPGSEAGYTAPPTSPGSVIRARPSSHATAVAGAAANRCPQSWPILSCY